MSERPRLLDAFCGAGGAAMGYWRAGFDVTGVDIKPQPRYPFAFIQGDAIEYIRAHGHEYDAIHASPPCQGYSRMLRITRATRHPRLIEPTRATLQATGRPYVIENVEGAPLIGAVIVLCGTAVGLPIRLHRHFETHPPLPLLVPPCACRNGVRDGRLVGVRLAGPKPPGRVVPPVFSGRQRRHALGVDWMSLAETTQAIPPAYTELIGRALLAAVEAAA